MLPFEPAAGTIWGKHPGVVDVRTFSAWRSVIWVTAGNDDVAMLAAWHALWSRMWRTAAWYGTYDFDCWRFPR